MYRIGEDDTSEILDDFSSAYPGLLKLGAKITVDHAVEDDNGLCDYYVINIAYPFIFDVRLVPEKFKSHYVSHGISVDDIPSMFNSDAEVYMDELFSPAQYEKFVDSNLEIIRQKLLRPNLDKKEALDALTGGFASFKMLNELSKKKRIMYNLEPKVFFNHLLSKIGETFEHSSVYEISKTNKWGYSLTATELAKEKPLIIGFNWGAGQDWPTLCSSQKIQNTYPTGLFKDIELKDLGSLIRVKSLFKKYYEEALDAVQVNFCFYRSLKEDQIKQEDLDLCKPIFMDLIEYLNPTILISFSQRLHDHFIQYKMIPDRIDKNLEFETRSGKRSIFVTKGKIKIGGNIIDYVKLPHPNYPLPGAIRKQAWEYCFPKSN